jgi:cytochrome c biogenesis protein CcmG, thiol:disulfide interchange protein DsbE
MTEPQQLRNRAWIVAIPVVAFAGLALLFWRGLSGTPNEIPSALIGKPVPEFTLPAIAGMGVPSFDSAELRKGQVTVVNVWASWCVPCRDEHPLLSELSTRGDIKVYGINYKDDPENARRFLGTLGQPFAAIGADESGRVSVDWGVYGVPETYVVDGAGLIRHKWIGPLTPEALKGAFAAEIEKAKTAQK